MAITTQTIVVSVFLVLFMISQQSVDAIRFGRRHRSLKVDKIYQLGDSISDTGNLVREGPMGALLGIFPYGQTLRRPTGRASDGLLMIDYYAMAFGLPTLNPYKNTNASFDNGVNFAVAGCTALSVEALAFKKVIAPVTSSSLGVQLGWMESHFNSTCKTTQAECAKARANSLFMVGEIGANDFTYAFFQNKTMDELRSMVPDVVKEITNAVEKVIGYGARRIMVPGNFAVGCIPVALATFEGSEPSAYDEHHCLKDQNDFAVFQNDYLRQAIQDLQKKHPNVKIVYGDYYNAHLWLVKNSARLGFDQSSLLKSCCGEGGEYSFNATRPCGFPGVSVCENPNKRISWDGVHMTQAAYKVMAKWVLRDVIPKFLAHKA